MQQAAHELVEEYAPHVAQQALADKRTK